MYAFDWVYGEGPEKNAPSGSSGGVHFLISPFLCFTSL